MKDRDIILEVLQAGTDRRIERRRFLHFAGASTAAFSLAACGGDDNNNNPIGGTPPGPTPTPTPTPPPPSALTDADVLNFALNLEYLEAQFYSYAAIGSGLASNLLDGTGIRGQVTGGRQVNFTDPLVAQYAREIASDERAHVAFLRSALGGAAVAQPAIDIGSSPNGAFSSAARAAGLVGPNQSFDPYANDNNFLLAAYIFEDVGVTAYKGASPLISNKTFLEAAAGILAAEAYHAGLVRTVLYRKGLQAPALIDASEAISNARDSLDGSTDLDQGLRPRSTQFGEGTNIVPTDNNAIVFSRTTGQVLNIAYLTAMSTTGGGFFPNGVNGNLRMSAASS